MKRWIALAMLLLACAPLARADAVWLTSLPDAQAQAKKENKLVLMNFTGSDWCPGCILLEKNVLSKPEFEHYAATNLVLVLVDFPLRKQPPELVKANERLQSDYQIDGFPTLVLTTPDGKVVWKKDSYVLGEQPADLIALIEAARKKYFAAKA